MTSRKRSCLRPRALRLPYLLGGAGVGCVVGGSGPAPVAVVRATRLQGLGRKRAPRDVREVFIRRRELQNSPAAVECRQRAVQVFGYSWRVVVAGIRLAQPTSARSSLNVLDIFMLSSCLCL
jgi:hypothetical protein